MPDRDLDELVLEFNDGTSPTPAKRTATPISAGGLDAINPGSAMNGDHAPLSLPPLSLPPESAASSEEMGELDLGLAPSLPPARSDLNVAPQGGLPMYSFGSSSDSADDRPSEQAPPPAGAISLPPLDLSPPGHAQAPLQTPGARAPSAAGGAAPPIITGTPTSIAPGGVKIELELTPLDVPPGQSPAPQRVTAQRTASSVAGQRLARPMSVHSAKSILPELAEALIVPFRGMGALWLPILVAVELLGSFFRGWFGLSLKLAYLGLLANYFARSARMGLMGDPSAPPLEKPSDVKAELVFPGLAIIALGVVLWGPPIGVAVWAGMGALVSADTEDQASYEIAEETTKRPLKKVHGISPPDEGKHREAWNPMEEFRTKSGKRVQFTTSDPPQVVQREDDSWVKVYPRQGQLAILPTGYILEELAYIEAGGTLEAASTKNEPGLFAQLHISATQALLLLGLVGFAFFYWPMALAYAAMSGSLGNAFNPAKVLPTAVKGGIDYAAIALVGAVVLTGGTALAATVLSSPFLIVALLLFLFGYVAGVQGYLMGRLASTRPGLLPDVE